jgi:FeS assembly SUF system protein
LLIARATGAPLVNDPSNDIQSSSLNREAIIERLRTVHDPEIPVNLYDLGLIYDLDITADNDVNVRMTLTTPNCPVADELPRQVKQAVEQTDGVRSANVELVWQPQWSSEMMSEDAKMQLEMMGISWKDPKPAGTRFTGLTVGRKPDPDRR